MRQWIQPLLRYSQFRTLKTYAAAQCQKSWKILFLGTDAFSLETLKILNNEMEQKGVVQELDVVTNMKTCLVHEYAEASCLSVSDWPVAVTSNKYDLGIVVSFGRLIPEDLINSFPHGMLNVHPSLLPKYRGAAPIIHAILNGDTETGISITQIKPKTFDVGPLFLQQRVPIMHRCSRSQLESILAPEGAQMLLKVLRDLPKYIADSTAQATEGASRAPKIKAKHAYIDWSEQTCDQIDQQYRALADMMPLTSLWNETKVRLLDLSEKVRQTDELSVLKPELCSAQPGTPYFHKRDKLLYIRCKNGWVGFENILLRKTQSAQAFYNGYLTKPGNQGLVFTSVANGLFQCR